MAFLSWQRLRSSPCSLPCMPSSPRSIYFGLALLRLGPVGMTMGGVFVTDPITATGDLRTSHAKLHELGAMLDAVPFAALLVSWSPSRNQALDPGPPHTALDSRPTPHRPRDLHCIDGRHAPKERRPGPHRSRRVAQPADDPPPLRWPKPVVWHAIKLPRSTAGNPLMARREGSA